LLLSSLLKPGAVNGRRQTLAGPYLSGMLFIPQTKNIVLKVISTPSLPLPSSILLSGLFPTHLSIHYSH
jgi:hypothetical protein